MTSDSQLRHDFLQLFGRVEHQLKRSGFLKQDRKVAEADWRAFAKQLGNDFFERIKAGDLAPMLMNDGPRRLLAENLEWEKENAKPFENAEDLIQRGVCRVRNSLVHGEKFIGSPDQQTRDETLVRESMRVLEEAAKRLR